MTKADQLYLLEQYLSRGDKELIYLMYDYLYKVLPGYTIKYNIYLSDDELDDIIQQSITKCLNKISGFRGEAKITSWLLEFAKYNTMNLCRNNKKNYKLYEMYKNRFYEFTNFQNNPLNIIVRKEQLICVGLAYRQLSYEYQYILYEVVLNGKSIAYMSRLYGKTYYYAKNLYVKGITALKNNYINYYHKVPNINI